jgi:hypothetical protein
VCVCVYLDGPFVHLPLLVVIMLTILLLLLASPACIQYQQ